MKSVRKGAYIAFLYSLQFGRYFREEQAIGILITNLCI